MVIIADEYDQVILDAFRNQPAEMPPIRAFRNSVKAAVALIPRTAAQEQQEYTRRVLTQTVPELRSAMLEQYSVSLDELAEIIAQRTGHTGSDLRVRVVAGALIRVGMAVMMESWGVAQNRSGWTPTWPGSTRAWTCWNGASRCSGTVQSRSKRIQDEMRATYPGRASGSLAA